MKPVSTVYQHCYKNVSSLLTFFVQSIKYQKYEQVWKKLKYDIWNHGPTVPLKLERNKDLRTP